MNSKDKCSDSSSISWIRLWLCRSKSLRLNSVLIQPLVVVTDAKPASRRLMSGLRKVRVQ